MNMHQATARNLERWIPRSRLLLASRDWTDRDGRHWYVRLETGPPPVLVFASEGDVCSVVVDFKDGIEDRSDEALERLLDEGREGGLHESETRRAVGSVLAPTPEG